MNLVERLGRRKQEARAALEAARGKRPAPPLLDRPALDDVHESQCVLSGSGADALAAIAVIKVLGKREGGKDVRVLRSPLDKEETFRGFDNAKIIESGPLWLKAAALLGHELQFPQQDDFALRLGAYIAGLKHKVTLLPSPRLASLGDFVDALLERAVVINHEPRGKKADYAPDRLFVSISLSTEAHDMTYLAEAGHPVLQWSIQPDEIGAEIVRWQIANALVNELVAKPEVMAAAMPVEPSLRTKGLALFAPHADILRKAAGTLGTATAASPAGWIAAHIALAEPEDHVAFACWMPHSDHLQAELSALQGTLRNSTKLAFTSSFDYAKPHPQAIVVQLTSADVKEPIAGERVLRVHSEDGDVTKLIESLREAAKLLSRK